MTNFPMISIIIPIYNAGKYLRQCLNSVIAQTYAGWECILVDDGSTDNSKSICENYIVNDTRFRYFYKENGGVSSARNKGLEHIRGEYICFFDADDIIPPDALAYMQSLMNNEVDMVMTAFQLIDENGEKGEIIKPQSTIILSNENTIFSAYGIGTAWQGYIWNRLFRTCIIKQYDMVFDTNLSYKEDGLFLVQYICNSNRSTSYGDKIAYWYRQSKSSAMGKFREGFNHSMISNIEAHLKIYVLLESKGYSAKLLFVVMKNIYQCIHRISSKYKDEVKQQEYNNEINQLLNKYLGRKYHLCFFLIKAENKINRELIKYSNYLKKCRNYVTCCFMNRN